MLYNITIFIGGGARMKCPKCGNENVTIQLEQVSSKSKKQGNGFGGVANNAARATTAICTFGLSNLIWKKSKGGEKEKFESRKVCLCQDCGNSWEIK